MESHAVKDYQNNIDNEQLMHRLHEVEEQYRILVENTTDVIWRLDLRTMRFLYMSPSVKDLRGYTQEEVMAQSVEEYLTPQSYEYVKELIAQKVNVETFELIDPSLSDVYIFEQPCKDGSTVWVEVTIKIYEQTKGTIELVGVSRNYTKQKQQQEELAAAYVQVEQTKNFLSTVMDAASFGIVCINCEGRITYMNQRYADTFGIDRNVKSFPLYEELLPPELAAKNLGLLQKCLAGQTVSFEENNLKLPNINGSIYGVYNPFFAADGKVQGAVLIAMNVTKQKETERQLVEAQQIARMGSYEWNLQKKCFDCSEGLLTLFEVKAEQVGKKSYQALLEKLQPDEREGVIQGLRGVITKKQPTKIEFRIKTKNGLRFMQSTNWLDLDNNGNPLRIVGSIVDITEQQKMAELQQEATLRLRDFARTLPDVAFIATETGHIVEKFGNKELRNQKDSETNLKKLMYKKDAEELLDKIQYALSYDKVQFGEYTMDTAMGKRTFEMRIAPMRYVAGGKRTVACNAVDVTDKNRAQRFLELSYEQRRQREILNDLVEGRAMPSQLILDQAWRVKLNLARPFSCYLVVIKAWKGKPLENWLDYQEGYQFFIDSVTEVLSTEMKAIVWESREGIAVLCPHTASASGRDIKGDELSTAECIKNMVYSYFPDASILIGIGEFHPDTFQNIALVYSQACDAVHSGQAMASSQDIFHYLDLGIYQILPLLSDQDKVLSFVDRTIGQLVEYDKKKGSNLVLTMEKILQSDNLKIVAEQMYVHHKTIAFRKKRIEKILGLSLDTLDNKTTLNTALKLQKMFAMNTK